MKPDEMDQLAYEFFREFARCEYCLKTVGLRKFTRDAKADWIAFSDEGEVQQLLEVPRSVVLKSAVEYYIAKPPKKQVVVQGRLEWDPVLPDHAHRASLVLQLVCRVRNNLFHGGKFNGHWFEPERSELLLSHGISIIGECVAAHPTVSDAYAKRAI